MNAIDGSLVKTNQLFNKNHASDQLVSYLKSTKKSSSDNINLQTADLWVKINGVDRTTVGSYDNQALHFYLNDIAGKIHTLGLESIDNSFNPRGTKPNAPARLI